MILATIIVLFCFTANTAHAKFKVIREWNYVNFTWQNPEVYRDNLEQQTYIPENNIIAGLKYFQGYYYITVPRMKPGVPATLTRILAEQDKDTSPLLEPFPSWEMNTLNDCDSLQNVQNVEIDPGNGWMWIIDGGRTQTLSKSPEVKCKPKLMVFDVLKMEQVLKYEFPEEVAMFNGSFLYDIVLDNTEQGYAYITDNSGKDPGIIVYSIKDQKSWKIRHSQSMRADPTASTFRVNDISISASLNLASIALGPRIRTSSDNKLILMEEREVYYSPLSSLHLYSINSSVLRNPEFASQNGEYQGTVRDYGMKGSQSVGMVMDSAGVLYYSLLALNSIARWDSTTPFQTGQKIIAKDERYLEWVNSFAFDESGNLTILVNRLDKFIYGQLNISESNFRLIVSNVGAKSYLHDESYNYDSSTTTEKKLEPEPTPEPEPSTTKVAPVSEVKQSSSASEKSAIMSLLLTSVVMMYSIR
ncbi:unnamed protein product [Ceutorhynchus assimilis]|uniref:Bee-milk protein n=1 Tax=Ceutorhynchus assimilis TaxID=467358 RepID=A0A9N9QSK0_9CUCU|nr:unnamed protein product [Ceutorhynchus assimilis]